MWYLCKKRGAGGVQRGAVPIGAVEKYLDSNNTIMSHIARLREMMGKPSQRPKFVKTVWGIRYTIEE